MIESHYKNDIESNNILWERERVEIFIKNENFEKKNVDDIYVYAISLLSLSLKIYQKKKNDDNDNDDDDDDDDNGWEMRERESRDLE